MTLSHSQLPFLTVEPSEYLNQYTRRFLGNSAPLVFHCGPLLSAGFCALFKTIPSFLPFFCSFLEKFSLFAQTKTPLVKAPKCISKKTFFFTFFRSRSIFRACHYLHKSAGYFSTQIWPQQLPICTLLLYHHLHSIRYVNISIKLLSQD